MELPQGLLNQKMGIIVMCEIGKGWESWSSCSHTGARGKLKTECIMGWFCDDSKELSSQTAVACLLTSRTLLSWKKTAHLGVNC